MADPAGWPSPQQRARIFEGVLAEGRRRVRRRRLVAAGVAALVLAGGAASLGLRGGSGPTHLQVVSPPATVAAACAGGGPVRAGAARVGMSVAFGALPAGFAVTSRSGPAVGSGQISVTATGPGASSSAGPQLTASASLSTILGALHGSQMTIKGRPATVETYGTGPDEQTTIEWSAGAGATILVSGQDISVAQVVDAAQRLVFTPGVAAPSVGSLGPVVPRSAVVSAATSGQPARVITWLVTEGELTALAVHAGATVSPGQGVIPDMAAGHPVWVVASSGGGSAVNVFDAVSGEIRETVSGARSVIPSEFAGLVDHSTDGPCPSPSPTDPSLQPPLRAPAVFPAGVTPIEAPVSALTAPFSSDTIQVAAGTTEGLATGDTVTLRPSVTGEPGGLVGTISQIGTTTAQVELVTSVGSAVPVQLDSAGDDAVVVGNGTGQPLSVDLVNRTVALRPGTSLVTTGPPYSPVLGGIAVGTVIAVRPDGDHSPLVTLAPDLNLSTLTRVDVWPAGRQAVAHRP